MEQVYAQAEGEKREGQGQQWISAAMKQLHTQAEDEKRQGQGQHGFLQLRNKSTHRLRARKGRDRVSMDFCIYGKVPAQAEGEKR